MEERAYPRPLSEFDMREVYRIIHNERIPGFVLLASEQAYIDEYRAAVLKETINVEETKPEEKPIRKAKRTYRRKKVEEDSEETGSEDGEEDIQSI